MKIPPVSRVRARYVRKSPRDVIAAYGPRAVGERPGFRPRRRDRPLPSSPSPSPNPGSPSGENGAARAVDVPARSPFVSSRLRAHRAHKHYTRVYATVPVTCVRPRSSVACARVRRARLRWRAGDDGRRTAGGGRPLRGTDTRALPRRTPRVYYLLLVLRVFFFFYFFSRRR